MTHSDDRGLVLPPNLAPFQVVIVPIYKTDEELNKINKIANDVKLRLEKIGISVKYDNRDTHKPGWKFAEYELKGVPIRLVLGSRDIENSTIELARRDNLEKITYNISNIDNKVNEILEDIQKNLFNKALSFREKNSFYVDTKEDFIDQIEKGGFVYAHWDGTSETENLIKQKTKATIRCIPLDSADEQGYCLFSGKKSDRRVIFAKSY